MTTKELMTHAEQRSQELNHDWIVWIHTHPVWIRRFIYQREDEWFDALESGRLSFDHLESILERQFSDSST